MRITAIEVADVHTRKHRHSGPSPHAVSKSHQGTSPLSCRQVLPNQEDLSAAFIALNCRLHGRYSDGVGCHPCSRSHVPIASS